MKRLLSILAFAVLTANAHATITRVQSAKGFLNGGSSTIPITVSALTAGNYLIVGVIASVKAETHLTNTTVTGGIVCRIYDATGALQLNLQLYKINTGGDTTVTVGQLDASAFTAAAVVVEYSATNLTPDVWATANGSSASPTTGTTGTTNYANELQIGLLGTRGAFSVEQTGANNWATSPTNSFNIVLETSTNSNGANADRAVALFEKFVTATGTATMAATMATNRYGGNIVTFREIPQVVSSMGSQ